MGCNIILSMTYSYTLSFRERYVGFLLRSQARGDSRKRYVYLGLCFGLITLFFTLTNEVGGNTLPITTPVGSAVFLILPLMIVVDWMARILPLDPRWWRWLVQTRKRVVAVQPEGLVVKTFTKERILRWEHMAVVIKGYGVTVLIMANKESVVMPEYAKFERQLKSEKLVWTKVTTKSLVVSAGIRMMAVVVSLIVGMLIVAMGV